MQSFGLGIPDIRTPASRALDPDTSFLAEAHITQTGRRRVAQARTARIVRLFPGRTSRELAPASAYYGLAMTHEQLHKRLPECLTAGLIRKGEDRTCNVTGRKATTWWPVLQPPASN